MRNAPHDKRAVVKGSGSRAASLATLRIGACAATVALCAGLSLGNAWAQTNAQPTSTPQNQTTATQTSGGLSDTGTKITAGRDLDNLQYDLNRRNALLDEARNTTPVAPSDLVQAMDSGVTVISKNDPYWSGAASSFNLGLLRKIKEAGFSTVRIPVSVFDKAKPRYEAGGNIDPAYLKKLDGLVNAALKARLFVILTESDGQACVEDSKICALNLPNVWSLLAQHYQDVPVSMSFELLDAPNGAVTPDTWNAWVPGLVSIIRESNSTRNIIVSAPNGAGAKAVNKLTLPKDEHLIVSFQYFEPSGFTRMGPAGASSVPASTPVWTPEAGAAIEADLGQVRDWAKANNRSVVLTGFGTASTVDIDARVPWTHAVSSAAKNAGFARIYAALDADSQEAGIFSPKSRNWIEALKRAILLN
jgi:endoglucanase